MGHTGIHAWGNRVSRQFFGGGAVVVEPRILCVSGMWSVNDCGSECTIIRVPHEEAIKMILYTQDNELIDKLKIASSRSKKVRDILDDLNSV